MLTRFLIRWLARRGYVVLQRAKYLRAVDAFATIRRSVLASGHLSTMTGKRPRVVQRMLLLLGEASVFLDVAEAPDRQARGDWGGRSFESVEDYEDALDSDDEDNDPAFTMKKGRSPWREQLPRGYA